MQFVLTTAGIAAIAASPGVPPILTMFKLGDSYGYVPDATDLDIRGTQVLSGSPSNPIAQSNNVIKYTIHLDSTIGDFNFGEVGLFLPGSILFALGSASYPILKVQNSGTQIGNNLVLDAYVSTTGTNYAIHAELGNSHSPLILSSIAGVDSLPSSFGASPNIYSIGSPDESGSIIAFSNNAAWNFTGYEEIADQQIVLSATATSVSVGMDSIPPEYPGELILQVMDGPAAGVVRIVTGYASVTRTFTFATPMNQPPVMNNHVRLLKKTQLRPNVAALLAGLDVNLTSGHLNDLLNYSLNQMVKKDGTVPMQAPLSMGTHRITDVGTPILDTDGVNKAFVTSQLSASAATISALSAAVTDMAASYFRRDGALPMGGNLNYGGFRSVNMAAPVNLSDGANKAFVENAIAAAIASISQSHNGLTGIQGGNGSTEFYHLTANERAWVTDLSTNGLPNASYALSGVTRLADANETGLSTSSSMAVTPESLYLAMTHATDNSLQTAVLDLVSTKGAIFQIGAGNPTGATSTKPEFYLNVSVTPPIPWVYYSGMWREMTARIAQFGSGAPTGATSISPILYFDTSGGSGKWVMYVYAAGAWQKVTTEYVQFGSGAPIVSTPALPSIYMDISTTPHTQYVSYAGTWRKVGIDSLNEAELYFFGQL